MLLCRTTVTIIPETPVQDCSISATWISLSAATRERNASLLALRFHYLVRLVLFQICFIYVFISLCAQLWREEKGLEVSQRSAIVTPCIAQVDHARFCAPTRFSLLIVTFPSSGSIFLPQGRKFPSPQSLRTSSNIFLRTFFFCREITGNGGQIHIHPFFWFCISFFKSPALFSRAFYLALQAYQVRSGAFVSGILLFPNRRVASSRCPRTDAWKMSWLCLKELYSSLVPMQSSRAPLPNLFHEPHVF